MLSLLHKVPPLGGCVSLQAEFKCLIFCVSRSAFVCTLKGLDSNKWKKKINRRQCIKVLRVCACVWVCVWSCVQAWIQIISCVCVCVLVEAELSCSGPGPDGIERGMKGKDKRRGEERWKRESDRCGEREHCSLDHSQRVVYVYIPVHARALNMDVWMKGSK